MLRYIYALSCFLLLGGLFIYSYPRFSSASVSVENQAWQKAELPLSFSKPYSKARIVFDINTGPLLPKRFLLRADDCLESFKLAGKELLKSEQCIFPKALAVDLDNLQPSSKNSVTAIINNKSGRAGFWIKPSSSDPIITGITLVLLGITLCFLALIKQFYSFEPKLKLLLCFCILGGSLRTAYFLITPYWLRSYDPEEHLDYIFYVANNLSIPAPEAGWQFFQGPPYYIITALIAHLADLQMLNKIFVIKLFSLILSIASLVLLILSGGRLFQSKQSLIAWGGVVALSPLAFSQASRISNDSLTFFLASLAIYFVSRHLEVRSSKDLACAAAVAALATLTKLSASSLLATIVVFLVLKLKNAPKHLLQVLLLVAIIISPIFIRMLQNSDFSLIGQNTVATLNPGLKISEAETNLTEISAVEILKQPYNKPWDSVSRRGFFWEYLYKSYLFGEFKDYLPPLLPQIMLIIFTASIAIAGYGLVNALKQQPYAAVFFISLLFASITSLLVLRLNYPYSPTQDARHIPWTVLVIAYFFAASFQKPSNPLDH